MSLKYSILPKYKSPGFKRWNLENLSQLDRLHLPKIAAGEKKMKGTGERLLAWFKEVKRFQYFPYLEKWSRLPENLNINKDFIMGYAVGPWMYINPKMGLKNRVKTIGHETYHVMKAVKGINQRDYQEVLQERKNELKRTLSNADYDAFGEFEAYYNHPEEIIARRLGEKYIKKYLPRVEAYTKHTSPRNKEKIISNNRANHPHWNDDKRYQKVKRHTIKKRDRKFIKYPEGVSFRRK